MSVIASGWAWQQPVEGIKHLLLLALADFADDKGECYPSQTTLAKRLKRGERTIRRLLKELEDEKLLERRARGSSGGGRTSDLYVLPVGAREPVTGQERPQRVSGKKRPVSRCVTGKKLPEMGRVVTGQSCDRLTGHSFVQGTVTEPPTVKVGLVERESPTSNVGTSGEVRAGDSEIDHDIAKLTAGLAELINLDAPNLPHAGKIITAQIELHGRAVVKQAYGRLKTRVLDSGAPLAKPAKLMNLICEDIRRERAERSPNPHAGGLTRFGV